jgi:hypothetical protein
VIGDCGFLDWGLRIETVDCRLRLAIEIADMRLPIRDCRFEIADLRLAI